eukprot:jgi/Chlat1/3049/Chrsp208S03295
MEEVAVVVFGVGGVGSALVRMLAEARDLHARQGSAHRKVALIDCTPSEHLCPALAQAAQRGYAVITANKRPVTGTCSMSQYRRLSTFPTRLGLESTVGAGLPVIACLDTLMRAGDEVKRVQGALSGTLGYLMTALEEGRAFSKAVMAAKAAGYTEPDPRDDLSGTDVARKALILGRRLGWDLELDQVQVESLVPPELASVDVDTFLERVKEMDEGFRERVEFTTRLYPAMAPMVLQGAGAGTEHTASGIIADLLSIMASWH